MTEKHIVALSGGKDSTAMALRLAEIEPREYEYICTPTGDELPEMEAHWKYLEDVLGKPLIRLQTDDKDTLSTLIEGFNALPNSRMRWCTRILKIEPCITYLEKQAPAVLYVGLRFDEPSDVRQGGVYDQTPNVRQIFPLRDWGWGLDSVWAYLNKRGVVIPRRTDCARCYHQRLSEWWNLWKDYPELYDDAIKDEEKVSNSRGKTHTFRNPARDTWPASLYELRELFAAGKVPQGVEVNLDLFGNSDICRVCSM